jgi:Flp pilus assembly protein TadG
MTASAERGSAVVEFVMVAALLLTLLAGLLQFGLALHVRNTAIAAAAEGARTAANADREPADGARVARALLDQALRPGYAREVTAQRRTIDGVELVEVQISAPLPVLGLIGPGDGLTVRAHALAEQ